MSKYQCTICGHLSFLNMGTDPIKFLNIECPNCTLKFKHKNASVTTVHKYIPDPNLELNCKCKYCKKLRRDSEKRRRKLEKSGEKNK